MSQFRLMIPRNAEPIARVAPLKRIDFRKLGRAKVITREEIEASGGREPDPALYDWNYVLQCWVLKDA
jgi:hypothetical protein